MAVLGVDMLDQHITPVIRAFFSIIEGGIYDSKRMVYNRVDITFE
jgi:hypothetical protein